MPNMFLVSYDITEDKPRNRVYELMCGYGERLQYSVFRCALDAAALAELENRLRSIVNHAVDQVLFFDLGPSDGRGATPDRVVGKPCKPIDRTAIII